MIFLIIWLVITALTGTIYFHGWANWTYGPFIYIIIGSFITTLLSYLGAIAVSYKNLSALLQFINSNDFRILIKDKILFSNSNIPSHEDFIHLLIWDGENSRLFLKIFFLNSDFKIISVETYHIDLYDFLDDLRTYLIEHNK